MKKIFILIPAILVFQINCISQNLNLGDMGAGAIDFLLQSPKTANQLNKPEAVALDIVGDLFRTAGERKYQKDLVVHGKDQIIIEYENGGLAKLVKDL
ncbi:MAG: hypothetical protein WC599_09605 [Bacteroidales bacterium]